MEVISFEVQCGHGSAIGRLDEELVWYLQARGLSRPGWRQQLDARIDRWMTSPVFYRWAISNPLTRWVTRRRAAQLFDIMAGFVHTQVLLACVRLQVFEVLREQPLSLAQLAQHCRMNAAAMQRLVQSAVALRLIERRGADCYHPQPLHPTNSPG